VLGKGRSDSSRDLDVFTGGDHEDADPPVAGDLAIETSAGVGRVVDGHIEESEAGGGTPTDFGCMLADPAAEHERIEPTGGSDHGRDAGNEPVEVDGDGKLGLVVAGGGSFEHVFMSGVPARAVRPD
jgi:hypothetical protein